MPVNDNHIVKIANGDMESFRRVYLAIFPLLCVYAYRIVKDESEIRYCARIYAYLLKNWIEF